MRNLTIAAAVCAALAAGSAQALPRTTASYAVNLVVSGASAQRDAIQKEVFNICVHNDPDTVTYPGGETYDEYRASPSANQDFRAYTCKINSALATDPALAGNPTAIIYYRSQGGSAYGVTNIVGDVQIKRLIVNASCATGAPGTANPWECPVTGHVADTDGFTSGNLQDDYTLLGVSDVEPPQFAGENFPTSTKFPSEPPFPGQLAGWTTATGTVFGIAVNDTSLLGPVTNLTRADLTSIFSGTYGTWNQVPNAAGTGYYAIPADIVVCKRSPGSGTQATASAYFNGVGCLGAPAPFVQPPGGPIFGNLVVNNGSAADLQTCIITNPNSIGILNYSTSVVAGRRFISVDGVAPSKNNAALGKYAFWSESTFNKSARINAPAKAKELALATTLQTRATTAATIPIADDVFALNNGGLNAPVLPPDASRPVGLFTKNGNNCQLPVGVL